MSASPDGDKVLEGIKKRRGRAKNIAYPWNLNVENEHCVSGVKAFMLFLIHVDT